MKKKLLWAAFVAALAIALYFDDVNYAEGFEQGEASRSLNLKAEEFHLGYLQGVREAKENAQTNAEAAAQAKLQEKLAQIDARMTQSLQQAFQAGQAAEAKAVIDHDLVYSAGPKAKKP